MSDTGITTLNLLLKTVTAFLFFPHLSIAYTQETLLNCFTTHCPEYIIVK